MDVRVLLLLAVVFIPLERLLALHQGQKILRHGWGTDLVYLLVNRLPIQLGLVIVLGATAYASSLLVPDWFRATVAAQPLWLQCAEALLLADLGFYAAHRAFHAVPFLWRFHAVHHSIEELDWLAGARVHPIDQILTKGLSLVPLYALGFSTGAIAIHATIYMWHSVLLHSNIRLRFGPLGWLVASPDFHHWHHANERSAYDRNFAGQLAVLDRLFGTHHHPPGQVPQRYGIDDPPLAGYWNHLRYPFRCSAPAAGDLGVAPAAPDPQRFSAASRPPTVEV